jgi:hypothetical protein
VQNYLNCRTFTYRLSDGIFFIFVLIWVGRIKQEDFLTGLPMNRESWSLCYGGARATHGFRSGKLYFEVHLPLLVPVPGSVADP